MVRKTNLAVYMAIIGVCLILAGILGNFNIFASETDQLLSIIYNLSFWMIVSGVIVTIISIIIFSLAMSSKKNNL